MLRLLFVRWFLTIDITDNYCYIFLLYQLLVIDKVSNLLIDKISNLLIIDKAEKWLLQ